MELHGEPLKPTTPVTRGTAQTRTRGQRRAAATTPSRARSSAGTPLPARGAGPRDRAGGGSAGTAGAPSRPRCRRNAFSFRSLLPPLRPLPAPGLQNGSGAPPAPALPVYLRDLLRAMGAAHFPHLSAAGPRGAAGGRGLLGRGWSRSRGWSWGWSWGWGWGRSRGRSRPCSAQSRGQLRGARAEERRQCGAAGARRVGTAEVRSGVCRGLPVGPGEGRTATPPTPPGAPKEPHRSCGPPGGRGSCWRGDAARTLGRAACGDCRCPGYFWETDCRGEMELRDGEFVLCGQRRFSLHGRKISAPARRAPTRRSSIRTPDGSSASARSRLGCSAGCLRAPGTGL